MSASESVFLFPFAEYWWFYLGFIGFVLALLLLDLGVFHKQSHTVSVKESLTWSAVWISLALLFGLGFYGYCYTMFPQNERLLAIAGFDPAEAAKQVGLEYITGFIIEKALAIDNIFVFVVVFGHFGIPLRYQHRVLFFGILGALVSRAGFIAVGSALLAYHWVLVAAGVFLIFTGVKVLFVGESVPDPGDSKIINWAKRVLPLTQDFHDQKFYIRQNGKLVFTPLFLALIFIEFSDVVFALDSVPAIFAVTKEPLIVFTSNIFAILGLRSLYFLLAGAVYKFRFLKFGLGFILIFVGLKMTWLSDLYGGKFPISYSLGIIGGILLVTIVASILSPGKPDHS